MKRCMLVIVSCMFALGAFGCSTMVTPVANTTDIQDVDFSQSFKTGRNCIKRVLVVFGPFGDASIVNAAKKAGIKKVEIVDYQSNWNPFVLSSCVIVYGN